MTERTLTSAQDKFARGVASGLSQAEAYRQAYPRSLKWKPEAVHQQACRCMKRPNVVARVAELAVKIDEVFAVEAAIPLREAMRIATSDIKDLFTEEGRVRLPGEIPVDTRRAIASFEIDEFGRIKYKFWDKNAALEKLFKHLGLFKDDNNQKAPVLINEIRLVPLLASPPAPRLPG